MKLNLVHLFPKKMNIYGDWGNIESLNARSRGRDIKLEYDAVDKVEHFGRIAEGDIFFMGGGQDTDQMSVWEEIRSVFDVFKETILKKVENNKIFLLICGGYQMFGHSFLDASGNNIPGLGILDIETRAPGADVSSRCIGNIVVEHDLPIEPKTLVGFENHGGQTYFGNKNTGIKPLGKVIVGRGNNIVEYVEGCVYKNVFGSYMHGSLLPKNPHLADYMLLQALKAKYGQSVTLAPLDSRLEICAHNEMLVKLGVK
jgi:CobQ-like glutamine amidotransferase family enzyme